MTLKSASLLQNERVALKILRNFSTSNFFDVEKSNVANRLKRVLPKFRGNRSEVRGVNGRSKFAVAAVRRKIWG